MLKAYRYRIYPNNEQIIQLAKTFGSSRFVFNYYLSLKIDLYKTQQSTMSKIDCNNHCNQKLKIEYPWLKSIDKFALTNAIYNLDNAYKKFFTEHNYGYPKFKSKHNHYYSYTTNYTNNNIEVNYINNQIKLPKLKWIKCKLHRQFEGKIKSATISQVPSGKYYVSILVDTEIQELPQNNNVIAFDLGLKEFLVDSNGNHIERPKSLYKNEDKLIKLQRQLCKMKKHSKNYKKQTKKIAKLHEKISNIRNDFLNKLSTQIINENQVIISENLKVANMIKNHHLSKSIADVGWSLFTDKLQYKAKWYSRIYHKIDTWYASSQICNDCGEINQMVKLLNIRNWQCKGCEAVHQRDENAAKNILNKGLEDLKLSS